MRRLSDDDRFVLIEEWETEESFAAYRESEVFRDVMQKVPPLLRVAPASLHVHGEAVK